jgi:hypothetical protein
MYPCRSLEGASPWFYQKRKKNNLQHSWQPAVAFLSCSLLHVCAAGLLPPVLLTALGVGVVLLDADMGCALHLEVHNISCINTRSAQQLSYSRQFNQQLAAAY